MIINSDAIRAATEKIDELQASDVIYSSADLAAAILSAAAPHLGKRTKKPLPVPTAKQANLFEEFWKVYPRKIGKKLAQVAFTKASADFPPEDIVAGAWRYSMDPGRPRDTTYIPYPTRWISEERWMDAPSDPKALPVADGNASHWLAGKGFGMPTT